jgi:hypothetical protein
MYSHLLTNVDLSCLNLRVDVFVVVLEDGHGPRDADARVTDVVLEEVGAKQLLMRVHPDRDDLVNPLRPKEELE